MASPETIAAQRWRKCVDTVLCDLTEDQLKSIKNNSGETSHTIVFINRSQSLKPACNSPVNPKGFSSCVFTLSLNMHHLCTQFSLSF